MSDPKVTRVRIEYEDGSSRECVGLEDCAKWAKLVNDQAGLWATRGWPSPEVNWQLHDAPTPGNACNS